MKNMICPKCKDEGKKSIVHAPIGGTTTLMAWSPGYWDEEGVYHENQNPNRTTFEYACSNGHRWSETK